MVINKNTKAFSFVEIIITISIIALLAIIAYTVNSNFRDKTNNSKVTSDIEIITNSLQSYKQETKTLPLPKGNNNYFKEDASYAHEWSEDIFWVHGFITEWTLPKRYLNTLPIDPKTNQYYAYWKLMRAQEYELSWINWVDWEPESFVRWNYSAEVWPYNLIREYNGPNFVYDRSESNFPYNPDERLLIAKVHDFDGSVSINDTITDAWEILSYTLWEWDKISVTTGWYAEIYFSDGSSSILWDTDRDSELILSKMVFKEENNLFTNIKLTLWAWTIWNKATSLDDNSDFEIYTTDASAAVRWTIFWLQKSIWNDTNITVKEWKVSVKSIIGNLSSSALNLNIKNNLSLASYNLSWIQWVIDIESDKNSYIEVNSNDTEKWINIGSSSWLAIPSTLAISTIPAEIKEEVLNNDGKLTNSYQPQLEDYSYRNNDDFNIKIKLNDILRNKADFVEINNQRMNNNWQINSNLNLEPNTYVWNGILLSNITDWKNDIKISFGYTKIDGSEVFSQQLIIPLIPANYGKEDLEIPCHTFTYGEDNECAEGDLTLIQEWWNLVWYAPYNTNYDEERWEMPDYNMYTKSGTIPASVSGTPIISDWSILINNNQFLKYPALLRKLNISDNFVIEMSVETSIESTPIPRTLFQIHEYQSSFMNVNTWVISIQNQNNWIPFYSTIKNILDWKYHKMTAIKTWDKYDFRIDWGKAWVTTFNSMNNISPTDYLYIWNNYSGQIPIWKKIDYVKIYTK